MTEVSSSNMIERSQRDQIELYQAYGSIKALRIRGEKIHGYSEERGVEEA